jgi:uncharacterized membrane protein
MIQPRILLYVFLLLTAVGLGQMAVFHPRMPATMASHFGPDGRADGWTSRQAFFRGMAGIQIGAAGLLLGMAYGMRYIPMRLINIPRKDYWADPEREDEARDYLFRDMLWFGCATMVLLNAVTYLTFRANLRPDHSMGYWSWVVIGAYLVWVVGWVVRMIWRFYRVPVGEAEEGID